MRRKRIVRWTLLTLAVLIVALVSYLTYTYFHISAQLRPDQEDQEAIEAVLDMPVEVVAAEDDGPVDTGEYVLLLGNDRREGEGWTRSDTIILARLDDETGSISMLSIPRDSYVNVPDHGMTKINHASAYGGVALAIQSVKDFTGLPVHHYVEIDFEGFERIIDALGGVEMNVQRAVRSGTGELLVAPGTQLLNGKNALLYARDRKAYADGDFSRMKNQQALMFAMVKKASQEKNFTRLPGILESVAKHLKTDWTIPELLSVASDYRGIDSTDMRTKTLPGTPQTIDGVSYVVIDEDDAQSIFEDMADGGFDPESE